MYTYSNLETHFGFASIPLDESRLDQRLDVAVNRYVEIGEGCVGGSKEKEKGEIRAIKDRYNGFCRRKRDLARQHRGISISV